MSTKGKEVALVASDKELATVGAEFPSEPQFSRVLLPRLGLISQDKTEGKGKAMKVVAEAGTFYIEKQTEETDEDGKKIWEREEIGTNLEAIILYQRKQLRMYDEKTEKYTSSPVYDSEEEIIPIFCDKQEVGKGTPAQLQAKYLYTPKGSDKQKSALEANRIVYVLYQGEVFQLNLRGTSMYSYLSYARKVTPNTVVTKFDSIAKENGDIAWNQMIFEALRKLSPQEVKDVRKAIEEIKQGISQEKGFFAGQAGAVASEQKAQKDFDAL